MVFGGNPIVHFRTIEMNELIVARDTSASRRLQVTGELVPTPGSNLPPIVRQEISPQIVIHWQPMPPMIDQALNNRAIVFAILLIAGPMGLPALWFSRRFSKPTKIVTTLAYVVGTVLLPIAAIYYYLEFSLLPLVNAFPK
jgi:hypothetical protein